MSACSESHSVVRTGNRKTLEDMGFIQISYDERLDIGTYRKGNLEIEYSFRHNVIIKTHLFELLLFHVALIK